jgi:hypothetical protein
MAQLPLRGVPRERIGAQHLYLFQKAEHLAHLWITGLKPNTSTKQTVAVKSSTATTVVNEAHIREPTRQVQVPIHQNILVQKLLIGDFNVPLWLIPPSLP